MLQFLKVSASSLSKAAVLLVMLLATGCGSPEQRAQSHYERGLSFLQKDDLTKARVELRNAVQNRDNFTEAWRALAQIEERAKNWQALISASRRVAELDDKDINTRIQLAKLTFSGGALDESLKWVNSAVQIDGRNTAALALRAAILLRLNDANGAIQEAHKVLAIDPASLDALIVLSAQKLSQGDAKGALQILDDVQPARREDLGVLLLKIRIFERLKDLPQIEATLRKLMERNPQEAAFQRELVKFYAANNRPDDAEREMRAYASSRPDDLQAGLGLVRFLQVVKGAGAAREELDKRIKAGRRVFQYQIAMAELDGAIGKLDDSKNLLERLVASATSPEDILTARTKLADVLLAQKNIPAVEALISDILKADTRNVVGLKLRASIRIDRGQFDDAVADLRQALNEQPRSAELLTILAAAYERSGSIELADKQLSDAMKASNYAPNYGLNYVQFLQRRGIEKHAESVLTELSSRNPASIQIWTSLAQLKLRRQDWAGAQEISENVRRLERQGGIADQIAGAALAGQQKYDESLGVLQNAYDANPSAVQPMVTLVNAYIQLKQFEKAEAFLASALKVNASNAEAHVLMGLAKLANNQPVPAEQSFKTAIEQQPKSSVGYRAYATFKMRQNDLAGALEILQAGLKQQPQDLTLRLTAANIFEQQGKFEAAITEYEALLKDQPGSMVAINNLASLLTDQRSDKESLDRAYSIARSLAQSQVPQFKDTLGWVYYRRGDYKNAVTLLEQAVAEIPNNATVRYHLGMTYAALRETSRASEELKKALDLASKDNELQTKIRAAMK